MLAAKQGSASLRQRHSRNSEGLTSPPPEEFRPSKASFSHSGLNDCIGQPNKPLRSLKVVQMLTDALRGVNRLETKFVFFFTMSDKYHCRRGLVIPPCQAFHLRSACGRFGRNSGLAYVRIRKSGCTPRHCEVPPCTMVLNLQVVDVD
jgi:hypothetical protein